MMALKDSSRAATWGEISTLLNTCKTITNETEIQNLYEHYMNGYLYMSMTDYPYASAFLNPMPAWPVNVSCTFWKDFDPTAAITPGHETLSADETMLLTNLKASADVYFNSNNQSKCTDSSDTEGTGTLDAEGWNVLACNELAMPVSMSNASMFVEEDFNYTKYTADCQAKYGLTPNYDWAIKTFGGSNVTSDFKDYSNIIFTNGNLDPWRAGGVTEYVGLNLPTWTIQGGAHHLDLRLPNKDDGDDVRWVREKSTELIAQWIVEY